MIFRKGLLDISECNPSLVQLWRPLIAWNDVIGIEQGQKTVTKVKRVAIEVANESASKVAIKVELGGNCMMEIANPVRERGGKRK